MVSNKVARFAVLKYLANFVKTLSMPEEKTEQAKQETPGVHGKYRRGHNNAGENVYVHDIPPKTLKEVYNEAMSKNMWIYDPSRREWFSPQEFKAFYERYVVGFANFFEQCQIKDPHEGIHAGYTRLVEVQNKLEDLTKRVLQHYKEKK